MLKSSNQSILLLGKSDWLGKQDCSGLLWFCLLQQVTETGSTLKKRERIVGMHACEKNK